MVMINPKVKPPVGVDTCRCGGGGGGALVYHLLLRDALWPLRRCSVVAKVFALVPEFGGGAQVRILLQNSLGHSLG